MNRNLRIALLIITTYFGGPLFGMEKPRAEGNNTLKIEDVALKQADIFYFGLRTQERNFDRACEFYKRAAGKDARPESRFLALHMLTLMAFAGQGGLVSHEWQNFAQQQIDSLLKSGMASEDILESCKYRLASIFKSSLDSVKTQDDLTSSFRLFYEQMVCHYPYHITKLYKLWVLNNALKDKKRCPNHAALALIKQLPFMVNFPVSSSNCLELNKTTANEQHITHFQELLTIESQILKKIHTEIVINLAKLFYFKKVSRANTLNTLDVLQKAVIPLKNKIGFPNITTDTIAKDKKILKVIGSFSLKRGSTLNFEGAYEYLQMASKSNVPKRIADGHVALAESYLHGLGIKPDYQKALQHFLLASSQNENKAAQARSALSLGYMYFYGDTKNNNADAAQPNYKLAEEFLRMACYQTDVIRIIPKAALLLGHLHNPRYEYGITPDLEKAIAHYQIASKGFDFIVVEKAREEIEKINGNETD